MEKGQPEKNRKTKLVLALFYWKDALVLSHVKNTEYQIKKHEIKLFATLFRPIKFAGI
jgi:hypothetical protein